MTPDTDHSKQPTPFPRGVQFTPVPNPLLSGLLEEITDIAELKISLRAIWALHRKKTPLPYITADELHTDRSVASMLGRIGNELETEDCSSGCRSTARHICPHPFSESG